MCSSDNLSAIGPFRIDLCDCGSVHVHLGPAMVRLDPNALPHLSEALELAQRRLPVMQRARASRPDDPRSN